ncbi:MAG: 16S rRNA (cytosine(967)-C(5))-methyltransferase RsmB [Gemmatimonadota bacterium]
MRAAALGILARVDRGGAYADILLDRALRQGAYRDARDRALLTELVMGTLRRRGTVDRVLSAHLPRPLAGTDPVARNALRLGAYQLLYTRVPQRAALFETVEAVKGARGEKVAGFVNAVLRAVARSRKAPLPAAPEDADREEARLSVPAPLFDALVRTLGEPEGLAFLSASLERPPFTVRANPFKVSRAALVARLAAAGFAPSPCRFAPDGVVLGAPGGVHADPGFLSGEYLVMDEGAQLIAPLLSPRPGDSVLDACAAPGGKTTHLAALSEGKARIVAADRSAGRRRVLAATLARAGTPGVETAAHDLAAGPLPGSAGRFDKVLVDAPCTGTGVIRRNPDAKWRFRPEDPARMAALQAAILANAWASVARGGVLAYATCTPLREENEEVAARFLAEARDAAPAPPPPDWPGPPGARTADGFIRLSPHRDGTDGFFAALFRKRG